MGSERRVRRREIRVRIWSVRKSVVSERGRTIVSVVENNGRKCYRTTTGMSMQGRVVKDKEQRWLEDFSFLEG